MKFKNLKSLPFLFLSIGLFIAGIALSSNALFNEQLNGEVFFDSINWEVEDSNYTSFEYEASFTEIKPGDAGMLSLGSFLDTDTSKIPTNVTFVYTVPVGLDPMYFELVDNTDNGNVLLHTLAISGEELRVTLDTSIFTRPNDVVLKWFYPSDATEHVVGTIYYGLEFEQCGRFRTLYTNVVVENDGEPSDIYTNVPVIVDTVDNTVSFTIYDSLGNELFVIVDQSYTDMGATYFLEKIVTGLSKDICISKP